MGVEDTVWLLQYWHCFSHNQDSIGHAGSFGWLVGWLQADHIHIKEIAKLGMVCK